MNDLMTAEAPSDRDRVLEAADHLFYSRGIQAVGMDAVRSEAGVPLKRLYASFPSKEALVLEVLRRRSERWREGLDAAIAAAATPRAKLLAVYDVLDDWFHDDGFRGCVFINAFGELGAVAPVVASAARDQKHAFREQLADLVAELGAPEDLAPRLALLAEGAQTTAAIDGSPDAASVARGAAEVLIDASLTSA
ncbi:TetR/AcrR family transcriptional regulator [Brachybacterium huguangmaarense]|uniref:TetR/AcrR family transcriptional regulator n=1 Tax=Brachybacterium huguangmaarense TaxID=1652028 RepID=A0ABY6G0A2_9MICO|nr:TetR/AcrR family transcriptional regulator [Brachybacterium huguangmaarense]UYG16628.1 TetR/AcrR family transcriptional regulator [Brachybacterium huguangmaarense]